MATGNDVANGAASAEASVGRPVIELRNFTKYYGKVRAVEDLDLVVYKGDIFGFLGPNGAGKTTTIRTMLDFIRRTSGEVRVLGLDSERDTLEIRRRTGYLPGDFNLYESLKVKDFLMYLLDLRDALDKVPRMLELAEYFELETDRRIKELSKGNRQKVGLVQAFMHDPELVMLDEPTSGLDPLMQQRFYKLVHDEQKKGLTVFMSSHVLAEIEHICDRVAIIRDGHLVRMDSISELKDSVGKVVRVTFDDEVDPEELTLNGVLEVKRDGLVFEMRVKGAIDEVIKALASHSVQSMTVETFSLEELFLELYEKDELNDGLEARVDEGGGDQ